VKSKAAVFKTQLVIFLLLGAPLLRGADLQLNGQDYFETHGLNVLLFHNSYHDVFGDQKMGGLEIILHEQRIATNGDVRLSPTPAQWDAIPHFQERKRGPAANELSAFCTYASRGLSYQIDVQPEAGGFRVSVHLDQPLPAALAGKAGFNLELLPTAYGTQSKLIAYGNNRADYSFIPGGMIPGVVIIQPDFPELKDAWPFLWYENEYVVDTVTNFILSANAANALSK
jgi:endoglucanase